MSTRFLVIAACIYCVPAGLASPITGYLQTNLVSNIPGLAAHTDANLKNPWGIATSATSPFWVSDQVTGKSTLYNSTGVPQALVVTSAGGPTGVVFNGTNTVFNGDLFLFGNLDGTITGWRGALGTTAEILFSTPDASYTGVTLGTTAAGTYLYAANAAQNRIDVFPSTGAPALSGNFTDPNLPAGYSVYNVQLLAGTLYVTYEKEGGPGGVIDKFDLNGVFIGRFATDGGLVSPWGLAIAPAGFGPASGALLVGGEDSGMIDAYNLTTGALIGTLADKSGNPLVNTGLWGLRVGNGGNGGDPNKVYFAAGINDENDGLFGSITFVPEPGTWVLMGAGLTLVGILRRRILRG